MTPSARNLQLSLGLVALLLAACTYEEPGLDISAYSSRPACHWDCSAPGLVGLWIPDSAQSSFRRGCDSVRTLTWYSLQFDACTYVRQASADTGAVGSVRTTGCWYTRDSVLWMDFFSDEYELYPRPLDRSWTNIDDNDNNDPLDDDVPRRYPLDSAAIVSVPDQYDGFYAYNASRWVYTLVDSLHLSLKQCCGDTCVDVGTFTKAQ